MHISVPLSYKMNIFAVCLIMFSWRLLDQFFKISCQVYQIWNNRFVKTQEQTCYLETSYICINLPDRKCFWRWYWKHLKYVSELGKSKSFLSPNLKELGIHQGPEALADFLLGGTGNRCELQLYFSGSFRMQVKSLEIVPCWQWSNNSPRWEHLGSQVP